MTEAAAGKAPVFQHRGLLGAVLGYVHVYELGLMVSQEIFP